MRIGYARDVKCAPILQQQVKKLEAANCQKIFISRKYVERGDLINTVNSFIREEDTIVIHDLSCLDKSLEELISFFHRLNNLHLSFESIEEGLIINRKQWSVVFDAIHLFQNLKQQLSEDEID